MRHNRTRTAREPTIALINIVFLMLVFFMVAGTLAQPMDGDIRLVRTADLDGRAPPDTLVVHADGRLSYRGEEIADVAGFMAEKGGEIARIVPDRALDARRLMEVAQALRAGGAARVMIVTERGIE
ncbi:ExbD/TolR family protein [Primorskyibacter sp. S187A]|uniref:ExbD/TolR family protein n=1 Tax=Primorskyibacter sp. S187A TaxID=3415130 RepID=UPI003C7A4C10